MFISEQYATAEAIQKRNQAIRQYSVLFAEWTLLNEKYSKQFTSNEQIESPFSVRVTCKSIAEFDELRLDRDVAFSLLSEHVTKEADYWSQILSVLEHNVDIYNLYAKEWQEIKSRLGSEEQHYTGGVPLPQDEYVDVVKRLCRPLSPAKSRKLKCAVVYGHKIVHHEFDLTDFITLIDSYRDVVKKSEQERLLREKAEEEQERQRKWSIKRCDTMTSNGHEFERLCDEMLGLIGYGKVVVTHGSGDFGSVIIAELDDVRYVFQCKCNSKGNNVGSKAIQEVFAGKELHKCHVAVIITNQYFGSNAVKRASEVRVVLWDRKKLIELLDRADKAGAA